MRMAEYEKKVRDLLKQHGCYLVRRGKGDHDIWYSPVTGINVTVDEVTLGTVTEEPSPV